MSAGPRPIPFAPAMDGLRGLAAQIVCLAHAAALALGVSAWTEMAGWLARVAVIVFFVASGFAIAVSIMRIREADGGRFDLGTYALHRVARIYPPYLGALAVILGVAGLFRLGLPVPAELGDVVARGPDLGGLARALVFANGREDLVTRLDGPLWSLRIEVVLYALAACAVVGADRRHRFRLAAIGVGAALAAGACVRLYFAEPAMLLFAFGAAAAWMARGRPSDGSADTAGLMLLAAVAVGGIPIVMYDLLDLSAFSAAGTAIQIGVGLTAAILLERLASSGDRIGSLLLRARPLGRFAYTLYLVHVPLLLLGQSVVRALLPAAGPEVHALSIAVVLVLVEAASAILARVLERPRLFAQAVGSILRPI